MRLTFIFPSDTNESWFKDFVETDFPRYDIERVDRGLVIDGYVNPDDRERMIEEGRILGATMYEHNDDNARRPVF